MVDRSLKKYAKVDYIFVDEISMAHEFMYKFFMLLKRKYQVKFIIAGDFEQLLPVKDRIEDCNYKDSRALYELCDGNRIQLLKCRRADDELFNLCDPKTIMQLDKEIFGKQFTDAHLCFTNKKRKEINNTMMQKATKGCKPLCLPALPYDSNSQDVMLAPGVPVICRVTRNKLNICNNEMFTIQCVSQQGITLENENTKVEIEPKDFQRLVYVAYATTLYKSQGRTITHPYTIHEWSSLDRRLRYVALSRATCKENINII